MRWASEQVEVYAETFRRQVYGVDQDGRVVEESLEMTKAHGAMVRTRLACSGPWVLADHAPNLQLRDVGLDFTFLFDSLLRPDRPKPVETKSSSRLQDVSVGATAQNDDADAVDTGVPGGRHNDGGGQLRPQASAVALARQSIFMLQHEAPTTSAPQMQAQAQRAAQDSSPGPGEPGGPGQSGLDDPAGRKPAPILEEEQGKDQRDGQQQEVAMAM